MIKIETLDWNGTTANFEDRIREYFSMDFNILSFDAKKCLMLQKNTVRQKINLAEIRQTSYKVEVNVIEMKPEEFEVLKSFA